MVIEKIFTKLPKNDLSIERFYCSCEERKKILKDTKDHYLVRLEKAKHDLTRAIFEFEDKCWDWTVIKAYYAIHHSANALLSNKKELFSKDHLCLIIALSHYALIDKRLFDELINISEKFSDIFSLDITFQLRKIGQYGVDEWKNITENDARIILDLAKKFVKFVEENIR